MTKYAENTSVATDRSRSEIEKTLNKYGAIDTRIGVYQSKGLAVVEFELKGRLVKIELPLPSLQDFRLTPTGQWRHGSTQQTAYEQGVRQRLRALLLVIKAKLEAVESGTRVSVGMDVWVLVPLFGWAIERFYAGPQARRAVEASLGAIKRHCEASS